MPVATQEVHYNDCRLHDNDLEEALVWKVG